MMYELIHLIAFIMATLINHFYRNQQDSAHTHLSYPNFMSLHYTIIFSYTYTHTRPNHTTHLILIPHPYTPTLSHMHSPIYNTHLDHTTTHPHKPSDALSLTHTYTYTRTYTLRRVWCIRLVSVMQERTNSAVQNTALQ